MPTPTLSQLQKAVIIAEQIEKLQAELAALVGGSSFSPTLSTASSAKTKGKRTMSPETIAKMKAAQQARWANKKGTPAKTAAPKPAAAAKKTKGITPEGRAKLAAAMKARWAAKKKAAK